MAPILESCVDDYVSLCDTMLRRHLLKFSIDEYVSLCDEMLREACADLEAIKGDDEFPLEERDIDCTTSTDKAMYGGLWKMLNPREKIRQRDFTLCNATQISLEYESDDKVRVNWTWHNKPGGAARVHSLTQTGTEFHTRANIYAYRYEVPLKALALEGS